MVLYFLEMAQYAEYNDIDITRHKWEKTTGKWEKTTGKWEKTTGMQSSTVKMFSKFGLEIVAKSKWDLLWTLRAVCTGRESCENRPRKLCKRKQTQSISAMNSQSSINWVKMLQSLAEKCNKPNREKVTKWNSNWNFLLAIGRLLEVFSMANKFEPVHRLGPHGCFGLGWSEPRGLP